MVFDFEAAWGDLLALLESDPRPNWGAKQLRDEMGRILARRRVNEAGLAQMLRLYGVHVDANLRDAGPTPGGIVDPSATVLPGPDHHSTEVDDGCREHAGAAA